MPNAAGCSHCIARPNWSRCGSWTPLAMRRGSRTCSTCRCSARIQGHCTIGFLTNTWYPGASGSSIEGMSEITTSAELRELLGEPNYRAATKERVALHPRDREWIATSPFVVLATSDADG